MYIYFRCEGKENVGCSDTRGFVLLLRKSPFFLSYPFMIFTVPINYSFERVLLKTHRKNVFSVIFHWAVTSLQFFNVPFLWRLSWHWHTKRHLFPPCVGSLYWRKIRSRLWYIFLNNLIIAYQEGKKSPLFLFSLTDR